jgi:hypothetical protein
MPQIVRRLLTIRGKKAPACCHFCSSSTLSHHATVHETFAHACCAEVEQRGGFREELSCRELQRLRSLSFASLSADELTPLHPLSFLSLSYSIRPSFVSVKVSVFMGANGRKIRGEERELCARGDEKGEGHEAFVVATRNAVRALFPFLDLTLSSLIVILVTLSSGILIAFLYTSFLKRLHDFLPNVKDVATNGSYSSSLDHRGPACVTKPLLSPS